MVKKGETQTQKTTSPKREILRHLDGTIELNITVSSQDVEKQRARIEEKLIENVVISGFRKGKAPKELAKKAISEEKVREELLRVVITREYGKAVEKHKLKPILTPQVHIEAFENGQDLKFSAEVAEEPKVKLGDYKKAIKDLKVKSKIVTEKGKDSQEPSIDAIITAGISQARIVIPNVIIEREVARLLSQLIDEIKALGMTLEQYLESKKITAELLRDEYKIRAQRDIKLEFFLRKVADEQNLTVTAGEITASIAKIENVTQKEEVKKNPYLVASIIRQQKTIDFLTQI